MEEAPPAEEPLPEPIPDPVPEAEIPPAEPAPEPVDEAPAPPPVEPEPPVEVDPPADEVVNDVVEETSHTPESTPQPVILTEDTNLEELAPDTPVELANGVVLTAQVVIALELLENPAELLAELFSDPGAVATALSNIGADMSPEEREQSEKVIVAAVIVGQIATQSAVTAAAGAAAIRRKI